MNFVDQRHREQNDIEMDDVAIDRQSTSSLSASPNPTLASNYPDGLIGMSEVITSSSVPLGADPHRSATRPRTRISTVVLHDVPIVSLYMDGKERLCLAQISNTLLKHYSYNEIHNRRVALGITCVQCTPVQLEILRRAGAMPASSRRCGMITKREAERLVKSFLDDVSPPRLPDDFVFDVEHDCGWGCRGSFVPSRYNSSRAKCIRCRYCDVYFSPNKFIFHFHRIPDARYNHPDAANFNSWRRHLRLTASAVEQEGCDGPAMLHAWEDVKAMFNGGNRRRMIHSGTNTTASSSATSKSTKKNPQAMPIPDSRSNNNASTGLRLVQDLGSGNSSCSSDFSKAIVEEHSQTTTTMMMAESDGRMMSSTGIGRVSSPSVETSMLTTHHFLPTPPLGFQFYKTSSPYPSSVVRPALYYGYGVGSVCEVAQLQQSSLSVIDPPTNSPSKFSKLDDRRDAANNPMYSSEGRLVMVKRLDDKDNDEQHYNNNNNFETKDDYDDEDDDGNGENNNNNCDTADESDCGTIDVDTVDDQKLESPPRKLIVSRNSLPDPEELPDKEDSHLEQEKKQTMVENDDRLNTGELSSPLETRFPPFRSAYSNDNEDSRNQERSFQINMHPLRSAVANRYHLKDSKHIYSLTKAELQSELLQEIECRFRQDDDFRRLKETMIYEVEQERRQRDELGRSLQRIKGTVCRELEQERKARVTLQNQLSDAQDALQRLSYSLLRPTGLCAVCANYRPNSVVRPTAPFVSNFTVANFTNKQ